MKGRCGSAVGAPHNFAVLVNFVRKVSRSSRKVVAVARQANSFRLSRVRNAGLITRQI
jgi:hypothetical protein